MAKKMPPSKHTTPVKMGDLRTYLQSKVDINDSEPRSSGGVSKRRRRFSNDVDLGTEENYYDQDMSVKVSKVSRLRNEVEHLRSELAKYQDSFGILTDDKDYLTRLNEDLKVENTELGSKLNDLQQQLYEKDCKCTNQAKNINRLENKNKSLNHQINLKDKLIEDYQIGADTLQRDINLLTWDNDTLKEEIRTLNNANSQKNQQISSLQMECSRLSSQGFSLESKLQETTLFYQNKVSELEGLCSNLTAERESVVLPHCSSLEEKCKQLERDKFILETQKNYTKLVMDNYKEECQRNKDLIKELKDTEGKNGEKVFEMTKELASLRNKIKILEKDQKDKDDEELTNKREMILAQIEALKTEEKFNNEKETLMDKIEALEARIDTLTNENSELLKAQKPTSFSDASMTNCHFEHENMLPIKIENIKIEIKTEVEDTSLMS